MKILLLGLALSFYGFSVSAFKSPKKSHLDSNIERRVDDILSAMTLEEKLGQLQQLDGFWEGGFRQEHIDLARKGLLGSTLNVRGAKTTNTLQRYAVEESRMKVPILFGFDVIHGYRTVFPVPIATASSFDLDLIEKAESVAAAESAASGVKWTFAPMVDIARDARWGRVVEGAGEDTYWGSQVAAARVRGFQGSDFSKPGKVMACAKHWVGYGAAEGGRDYNSTDISEVRLREVYFPPFKAALDEGVGTFMSAFNDLNGVPASANYFTLTKVLKGEWNFSGFVVSDYNAIKELINHGNAANESEAAYNGFMAGVDMEMVSRLYNLFLPDFVRHSKISMDRINESVRRILRIKMQLGLFEHPYVDENSEAPIVGNPKFREFARQVAADSIVLLKNETGILPLKKNLSSIALIGALADDTKNPLGSWYGDGRPESVVSVLQGFKNKLSSKVNINYAKGCEVADDGPCDINDAVEKAKQSEVAVVVVGETAEMSGEAASRSNIDLPGRQNELVQAIKATGVPTVVVLMNGRPLSIEWITKNVKSIVEAWFPGMETGNALADILFGDVNPSAKLPITFPRNVGQIPIYYNHKNTGRPDDPNDKYTSKYLDLPSSPLYPFGYGLSYTKFEISDLELNQNSFTKDETVQVRVKVRNSGAWAGKEVVQVYIRDMAASITRPVRELKRVAKVELRAGETKTVQFQIPVKDLGFVHGDMTYSTDPGEFKLWVGNSSIDDNLGVRFNIR